MRRTTVALITALWLTADLTSAGPVDTTHARQILSQVDLIDAKANIPRPPGPRNLIGKTSPYQYGDALKTSAYLIPRPALQGDDASTSVVFSSWHEYSGYKMYMTWRDGDHDYFTGKKLFKDIGEDIYKIRASLTDPIDPENPGNGSYEQYYAIPLNHTQPNKPADFHTAINDNEITSASLEEVLQGFRWCHPNPQHVTTQTEFDQLCRVYYKFIKDHQRAYFGTNVLPFATVGIPGVYDGQKPLIALNRLLPGTQQIVAQAPPIPVLPADVLTRTTTSGRQAFHFTRPPTGFAADPHWYHFRMKFWYEVQQVPSQVNIRMPPAPDITPEISFRDGTNRSLLDGAMCLPPFAGTGSIFFAGNADGFANAALNNTNFGNNLHAQVNYSTMKPPVGYTSTQLNNLALRYYERVPSSPVEFDLTADDISKLAVDPSQSKLAAECVPVPMFTFDVRHLADFGPDQMQTLMQSNNPPVPPSQIRQSAMQIYVNVEFQIWQGDTPESANNEFTASKKPKIFPGNDPTKNPPAGAGAAPLADYYRVVDDIYCLTENYLLYLPKSLEDLKNRNCVPHRAASSQVIGDPYKRNTQDLPRRNMVRVTPTAADPGAVFNKNNRRDQVMAVFPDARYFAPGTQDEAFRRVLTDFAVVPQWGNPNSRGEAFVQATIGRGLAFNYVYSRSGQKINPNDPRPPQAYWTDAQHVAAVWPYETGTLDRPDVVVKVGPYILNLDVAAKEDPRLRYPYSEPPFHYSSDSQHRDEDLCIPVVLSDQLRAVVNDMYKKALDGDVHMTADVSARFGYDILGNGYRYAADLKTLSVSGENLRSLVLRVPTILNGTTPFPFPWGVVPLLPQFSTFIGTLGADYPGANLLENPSFIGSYDARVKTNFPGPTNGGYSPASLDQTVQVVSVDGCGNQHIEATLSIASASVKHPTCSMYVKPTGNSATKGYTLGVPINPGNLIIDNQDARFSQYTTRSDLSLSSRVTDQNLARLQRSDVLVLDGTLGDGQFAPVTIDITRADPRTGQPVLAHISGQAYNPGVEFFRPVNANNQPDPARVVTKGHQVDLEFAAESVIPGGQDVFDLYDNAFRQEFRGKEFAATIRRLTVAIYPPNQGGGCSSQPEVVKNLFVFLQKDFSSSASGDIPGAPVGQLSYVFRQSTSPMPLDSNAVPAGNSYYLVQADVEDINGAVRRLRIPVWVRDEGADFQKLDSTRERGDDR